METCRVPRAEGRSGASRCMAPQLGRARTVSGQFVTAHRILQLVRSRTPRIFRLEQMVRARMEPMTLSCSCCGRIKPRAALHSLDQGAHICRRCGFWVALWWRRDKPADS